MYSPLFHAPLLAFRREFKILCSLQFFSFLKVENVKALLKVEEAALEEMKKELKARLAEKTVHDLYKKVKILQV